MTDRGPDDRRSRRDVDEEPGGSDGSDGSDEPDELVLADDALLRYRPDENAYRAAFDPALVAPSLLVPLAVAALRGVSSDLLPPLYHSLDPAALDRLCEADGYGGGEGGRDGDAGRDGDRATTVSFTYAGYRFTVEGTGELLVREVDG